MLNELFNYSYDLATYVFSHLNLNLECTGMKS